MMVRYSWLFAVIVAAGSSVRDYCSTPPEEEPVRIYYMKYGGMYCGHMERHPCGIRLSKCTDTRIYECLQDVAYEDDNAKPSR